MVKYFSMNTRTNPPVSTPPPPSAALPQANPKWSRTTRLWVSLVTIISAGIFLYFAFPLIQVLIIALLLALLIDPLVQWLMRKTRFSRAKAGILVYLLFLVLLASIPAGLGTAFYNLAEGWFADLPAAAAELENFLIRPIRVFGYVFSPSYFINDIPQALGASIGKLPGGSLDILSGVTTNLLWGMLILITLYYLLKDGPKLKPWFIRLFLPAHQGEIENLLEELVKVWTVFMRAQIIIFFVLAFLLTLSSLAVIWLYQTGLIRFSTLGFILVFVLIYSLVQQVDNLWLRPQLLGHHLNLHPGVVVVALIGALAISGVLGAIIIIPTIASVKVLAHYIHQKMLGLPAWSTSENQESPSE